MGLLAGTKILKRSAGDFTDKQFWLQSSSKIGGSSMTRAGVRMGAVESMQVSAHINCIQRIATTMAAIPAQVWKTRPPGRGGGRDLATSHPTNYVLNGEANYETTSFQWMISRVIQRALWGTSYDTIDRNRSDQVTALWQSQTKNVVPFRLSGLGELSEYDDVSVPGDWAYQIKKTFPEYEDYVLPRTRVLRIPGMTSFNGIIGIPSHQVMRQQLSVADALAKWESDFFGKGYSPAYIGAVRDPISKKARDALVEGTAEEFAGFNSNHQIMLGPEGVDLTLAENRLDHAMLQQRCQDAYENICGYWGVPTTLNGKTWGATYNNSIQHFLQYLKLCIFPWAVNDIQAFNACLFTESARRLGYHADYDVSILEKMDGEMWAKMINAQWLGGAITSDEIREERNRNPLPGGVGQKTYVQAQMKELGSEEEPETNQNFGKPKIVEEAVNE